MKNIPLIQVLAFILALLLSACAGTGSTGNQYSGERLFTVAASVDAVEAINRAKQAFQQQNIEVTGQNPQSGYLSGRLIKGSWINKLSYLVEVRLNVLQPGRIKVSTTATAGPEVAFTTDLDNIVNDFYVAYEPLITR